MTDAMSDAVRRQKQYLEALATVITTTVLQTVYVFDEGLEGAHTNYFSKIDPHREKHERRVLFILQDPTVTPQVLHSFDIRGLPIGEAGTFDALPVHVHATLALFIATVRAATLVACAKYPTLESFNNRTML